MLILTTILFVCIATLWPFRFEVAGDAAAAARFAVRWGYSTELDIVRNLLLFAPLGFVLARVDWPGGAYRRLPMIAAALMAFAYLLEVVQGFVPSRFPSLVDVLANTVGGVMGAVIHEAWRHDVIWPKVSTYTLLMCLVAVPLHSSTLLHTWDRSFPLIVGNELTGDRPWRGRLFELCFSDQAVPLGPSDGASQSASCSALPSTIRLDCEGCAWAPPTTGDGAVLTGERWFSSQPAGRTLTDRIRNTSEFSMLAVFEPATGEQRGPARIVSLSANPNARNFTLGQDGAEIVVRLRTRATNESGTAREVRVEVTPQPGGRHRALFTYDGSTECLVVDGRSSCISLTPGIATAAALHKTLPPRGAVRAWDAAYYAAWFVPLGVMLGPLRGDKLAGLATLTALIASAALLEFVSASVPHRAVNWGAVGHATAWGVGGLLCATLIGHAIAAAADRRRRRFLEPSHI